MLLTLNTLFTLCPATQSSMVCRNEVDEVLRDGVSEAICDVLRLLERENSQHVFKHFSINIGLIVPIRPQLISFSLFFMNAQGNQSAAMAMIKNTLGAH